MNCGLGKTRRRRNENMTKPIHAKTNKQNKTLEIWKHANAFSNVLHILLATVKNNNNNNDNKHDLMVH